MAKSWKKIARKRAREKEEETPSIPEGLKPHAGIPSPEASLDPFTLAGEIVEQNEVLKELMQERQQLEQQMAQLTSGGPNSGGYQDDPRFTTGEIPSYRTRQQRDQAWARKKHAAEKKSLQQRKVKKAQMEQPNRPAPDKKGLGMTTPDPAKPGALDASLKKAGKAKEKARSVEERFSKPFEPEVLKTDPGNKGIDKATRWAVSVDKPEPETSAFPGLSRRGNFTNPLDNENGLSSRGMALKKAFSFQKENDKGKPESPMGKAKNIMATARQKKEQLNTLRRKVGEHIPVKGSGMGVSVSERFNAMVKEKLKVDTGSLEDLAEKQNRIRQRLLERKREERKEEEKRDKQRNKRRNKEE
ncbi:hypothetical protein AB9P05_04570 [Roseivirga sp. BDSF3-8]|uniref:hypothetical protein n=1 Tax=Roseivirga sp. BDSF3-8 TaxID=3241598 RepID=UPI003531B329